MRSSAPLTATIAASAYPTLVRCLRALTVLCAVLYVAVPFGAALAQDTAATLSADERGAIAFCQGFADIVRREAPACDAMGRALDAYIVANTAFVSEIAHLDSDAVGETCTMALGNVAEPLMACAETPEVAAALARLSAIEDSRVQGENAQNEALERTCAELSAALGAASGDDCELKNAVVTRFAAANAGLFTRLQAQAGRSMDKASMERAGRAVAVCFEALLTLPAACREQQAFKAALEALQ